MREPFIKQLSNLFISFKKITSDDKSQPDKSRLINLPESNIQKNISPECIFERLTKLGAHTVSNESFQHVATEIKTSRCLQTATTKSLSPYLKCELIFGDRFYWVVKLKRLYRNLFQIKLMNSIGPSIGMSQTMSLSNLFAAVNPLQKRHSENFEPDSFKPDTFLNETNNNISANTSSSSANSDKAEEKCPPDDTYLFSTDIKLPSFSQNLRPIGWSKANGYFAQKPSVRQLTDLCVNKRHSTDYDDTEIKEFFTSYLDNINSFRQDSHCELENNDLDTVDIVRIKSNVAGRLLVEFAESNQQEWMFYLDSRLHPLGWARKNNMAYSSGSTCLENLVRDEEKSMSHFCYYSRHSIKVIVYLKLKLFFRDT